MNGSGSSKQAARAIALGAIRTIVLALVIAFAVSWLVERAPAVGRLLGIAGLLLLGWTLWRKLRAPHKLMSIGAIVASIAIGALAVVLVSSVRDAPEADVIAAATTAAPSTSSPPSTTSATTSTTATTTTMTATSTTSTPAATPTTSTTPAGSIPEQAPPPLREPAAGDPTGDPTGGTATDDVTGITVDGTTVSVFFAAPPIDDVWLWSSSDPANPTVVEAARSVDHGAGSVVDIDVSDTASAEGPWAVSTRSGDRMPDVGFVENDNSVATVGDLGTGAAAVERTVAEIQAAVPSLDPLLAELVVNLAARQTAPGSFVLELLTEGTPTGAQFGFYADYPEFVQTVTDTDGTTSLWMTAAGGVACDRSGLCTSDAIEGLALDAALAVVANPAAMQVDAVDTAGFEGATRCIGVQQTVSGGPSIGTSCWDETGTLVVLDRPDSGIRFVRIDSTRSRSELFDSTPEVN